MSDFLEEVVALSAERPVGLHNVMSSASRHYLSPLEVRNSLRGALQENVINRGNLKPALQKFLGLPPQAQDVQHTNPTVGTGGSD